MLTSRAGRGGGEDVALGPGRQAEASRRVPGKRACCPHVAGSWWRREGSEAARKGWPGLRATAKTADLTLSQRRSPCWDPNRKIR